MTTESRAVGPTRILFIDDEARDRLTSAAKYVERLEQERLYSVVVKASYGEGIAHVDKNRAPEALVILDIIFDIVEIDPGVTSLSAGISILKDHIRARGSGYAATPVLILTNRNENDIRKEVEDCQPVWVSQKAEVPPLALAERVRHILEVCRRHA